MNRTIDEVLDRAFTTPRIIEAFYDYKLAKWDRLSDIDDPEIGIPLGTDGVTYQAFEKQLERNAKNIAYRIGRDSYVFHPFREIDRKKDRSRPLTKENTRTLGIASVRDALVQTILYKDVLYEPIDSVFKSLDAKGPVSFAYRKGKSAPLAAKLVHEYAREGYWFVYDADLSTYFDTIPHDRLLDKLGLLVGGNSTRTFRLVRRFVRADRTPHRSYKDARCRGLRVEHRVFHWRKPRRLRPKRNEGVLQGGVLSGMLANLHLHEFDEWVVGPLADKIDLKYVRYADDFLIMLRSPDLFDRVEEAVKWKLASESLGLSLNEEKTTRQDIRDEALDFVGFCFDGAHTRVRKKSVDRFKKRIEDEVFQSVPARIASLNSPERTLDWLIWRINWKIEGLRGKQECPACRCDRIGAPRSWMAFFQVVTDREQLRELDRWIRERIYDHIFTEYGVRVCRRQLKGKAGQRGLKSLVHESHDVRRARMRPCLCDIAGRQNDIWQFASDLFEGRSFQTLYLQRTFHVPRVDRSVLQVSVGARQYRIGKEVFQNLWERLVGGELIYRADLEREGIGCTSQIVALMANLPGIVVGLRPISLAFRENPPADFLARSAKTT